ncbi:unnamed protein product [Pleuronectes platessa]|uniref:Uncharacterized protein n=1 Tax=Pleuronectes platessa TaxID=8262 RepID=A0A9N7Z413_PLEPL|nr:unnamed protein product [Pleuronectes platessa]
MAREAVRYPRQPGLQVKEISQSTALHVPNKNSASSATRNRTPTLPPNFLRFDGWLTPPRPREGSREVNKLLPVSSLHLRRLRERHLQATHPTSQPSQAKPTTSDLICQLLSRRR